jgi:hypothetical protein
VDCMSRVAGASPKPKLHLPAITLKTIQPSHGPRLGSRSKDLSGWYIRKGRGFHAKANVCVSRQAKMLEKTMDGYRTPKPALRFCFGRIGS